MVGLAVGARPVAAGSPFASIQGHLAGGYVQLVNAGSPGGSLGFGAGVDFPVRGPLRAGVDIAFDLLGSSLVERGSLSADVEYSVFEVTGLLHWVPPSGPFRISAGPGLFHGRADLSSSGPVAFEDLAVDETAPGGALSVELLSRRESLLRAGLELGVRTLWMSEQTWTLSVARLTVHY